MLNFALKKEKTSGLGIPVNIQKLFVVSVLLIALIFGTFDLYNLLTLFENLEKDSSPLLVFLYFFVPPLTPLILYLATFLLSPRTKLLHRLFESTLITIIVVFLIDFISVSILTAAIYTQNPASALGIDTYTFWIERGLSLAALALLVSLRLAKRWHQ